MSINQAPILTNADGNGAVKLDLGPLNTGEPTVVLQADGKIVINGHAWTVAPFADETVLIRYNADGTLDTAFGADGVIPVAIDPLVASTLQSEVAVQADGKIVVSGDGFAVTRYNSDGSPDTSFGTGGMVVGSRPPSFAYGVVIEADGKIIATGDNGNFGVARFDSNGNRDLSFGVGGEATASFGSSISIRAQSLVGQPDGKIVVAGSIDLAGHDDFALARYNTDGSLDATFGSGGKVTTDFASGEDEAFSVTLQADGKIIAAGSGGVTPSSTTNFVLARYNADGSLDTSFGAGGKVTTDGGLSEHADSVKVQSDGKIVVAGSALIIPGNKVEFVLLRYNSDGSLDSSFGTGGKVVSDFGSPGNPTSKANSLVIQPDGKILVVGTTGPTGNGAGDFVLARYNSDGSLDTSFGNGAALNAPAFFVEGKTPTVLNAGATVHDADLDAAGSYAGASLTLARQGGADAQDLFGASGNLAALNEGGNIVLSGVTIGTVTHNSAGMLALTFDANATGARVNEAMRDITYFNTSDTPVASVQVDWSFSDGNTGPQGDGGALAATGSTTVHIAATDDAPVNTVPEAFDAFSNTDHAITGLSVSDPDTALLKVTLSVDHGTLTVGAIGGVTVEFSGFHDVRLTGSPAQIDAALAAANNVIYHSTAGFHGTDVLAVDTNNATDITSHDNDTVAINVMAKNPAFDFNGDSFSDILFRDNTTGDTIYLDVHNNVFHNVSGPSADYSEVGAGDLNGDNFGDVLWRNDATGDTSYLDVHNNVSHSLGGSPVTYHVVATGDFNGDNFSDVLWRNNSTGDTGYTDIHNGGYHSLGGSPTTYGVVGIADFNGDNFSDILFRNNATGDTGYTDIHNGGYHSLGGSPTTYSVAGLGDFNGDHFSDILFRNNSTGDTGYTDIHNGGYHSLGGSSTAYAAVGVADYNGDGFSDILFRDNSTGDTGYTDVHNGGFHSVSAPSAAYLVMA